MKTTLKVIRVTFFRGREDELCLIKFFIKNASALQHLSLLNWFVPKCKLEEVREKLFSFKVHSSLAIDF